MIRCFKTLLICCLILTGQARISATSRQIGLIQNVTQVAEKKLVSIELTQGPPPQVGQLLRTGRYHQTQGLIPTGSIRVRSLGQKSALAEIESDGTEEAKQLLGDFALIMQGDPVWPADIAMKKNIFWVPRLALSYDALFDDPTPGASSLSLSSEGLEALEKIAARLGAMPIPRLFIKGFTQQAGDFRKNQAESYQRALAVRNHLVYKLGFDPDRVLAIGHGELEREDKSFAGNHTHHNRRIEFEPEHAERLIKPDISH